MNKIADFYAKAMADENAKAKLNKVIGENDLDSLTDDELREIGDIAKGLGFDISLDEAKDYIKSVGEELSEDALEAVAGGGDIVNNHCKGKDSYIVYEK